ncbi:MAG: NADH:flavin oxidoreductase [Candidatus Latescibacterota bacterium]|jgi:2,4-dienoyl-CoA reductase-like NADH-dependent reductase (Old Yellow Enzyme family)
MPDAPRYPRLSTLKTAAEFRAHVASLGLRLECDEQILRAPDSPLARSYRIGERVIGNRFAIQPMEGWDGTEDGMPTEYTRRRWANFGRSGAKLIWGGEACAVVPEGRANPNQLMVRPETRAGLAELLNLLRTEHLAACGSTDDLLVGLQLTHSGRFCRPYRKDRLEPGIAYHHPILDRKFGIAADHPVLTDEYLDRLVEEYVRAASIAHELGFQFVDVKHCHGYLGHELLSAYTRPGKYGSSLENRTRFLRQVVAGIRAKAPGLGIGVRLSLFDLVPFRPDPAQSEGRRLGPGVPEPYADCLPYRYGFGVDANNPERMDLTEPLALMTIFEELGVELVNLSCGSPYYNPHIQRPALFPPSDGYQPPEDPLVGVARQLEAVAAVKARFPAMPVVGTGYSYLQEFLPQVGQAEVRSGRVDFVGLGRMVLAYPELPRDVLERARLERRRLCRTFSDCTTAPRKGMISGCFPLDPFYRDLPEAQRLKELKAAE